MRVLIIKMSSLGDVLHLMPALSEAQYHYPHIQFDWVVEESFAQLPSWHPAVTQVIPVAFRRLRKYTWRMWRQPEWQDFLKQLRAQHYDLIIDAQGLIKSAFIARLAHGQRAGLSWRSARESLASCVYHKRYPVDPTLHAVIRMKRLMAQALQYQCDDDKIDYNLELPAVDLPFSLTDSRFLIFFHGTTWVTKLWPETYWRQLAHRAQQEGLVVYLPWGSDEEYQRAMRLAEDLEQVHVLPKLSLIQLAQLLVKAAGTVTVDTGLGHVAAALAVPTVALYGATDPKKTGTSGHNQTHLAAKFECAPCLQKECTYTKPSSVTPACYTQLPPNLVWQYVKRRCLDNEQGSSYHLVSGEPS